MAKYKYKIPSWMKNKKTVALEKDYQRMHGTPTYHASAGKPGATHKGPRGGVHKGLKKHCDRCN